MLRSPSDVGLPDFAELHCRSNFSFLTGASQPAELVRRAQELGYRAIAITDECSLAGVVRAYEAVKELRTEIEAEATKALKTEAELKAALDSTVRLIIGAEMRLTAVPAGTPARPRTFPAAKPQGSRGAQSQPTTEAGNQPSGVVRERMVEHRPQDHPHRPTGDGARLLLLAKTRRGYANLSRWISLARRRADKGSYLAYAADVEGKGPDASGLAGLGDCLALLVVDGPEGADGQATPPRFEQLFAQAMWLKTWFGADRAGLALALRHRRFDDERVAVARRVAGLTGLPIVATGDVLMHSRSRKPLQDVLTATRLRCTVAQAGTRLESNGEAHLRSRQRLAELYDPAWLQASVAWAEQCEFSLQQLAYEYPREIVPEGRTPESWLRELAYQGADKRYPKGVPAEVRVQIERELKLIAELQYEPFFLTVADLVDWARSQGILCQGRGSAANSTVCYCLGVTEVDPTRTTLLFERFVSAERKEPPDIDLDFEHQRREEVIQYIYRKYGRHRAAMTGVVISYRGRSALRDVGRALGFDLDRIEAVTKQQSWWTDHGRFDPGQMREHGFDPESPLVQLWAELATQLRGFPRHLSQHPGGFLIANDDVSCLVPVENATMDGRTVIQWDKDDLDTLKLIKVDVLALGMLSAIRRGLTWVGWKSGAPPYPIQKLLEGQEDKAVYDMLCAADAVGVFQVESRAQLSMLPRLRPQKFYDLVVEVAIVRPGPIQGGMVHPYLKRRNGEELEVYPKEELREALGRTKGIPIFQEQVMQLAIVAADFTPGEADQLRRAMAAWKRRGGLEPFEKRLVGRMVEKGYSQDFAEAIFRQIQGFGEYGFPESHAASFALLVYVSAWIKRHHPDAFLVGLLNSQPMGFYAPAQLVRDARAHGVAVRPVDVMSSDWDSTLEAIEGVSGEGQCKGDHETGCEEAGCQETGCEETGREVAPDVAELARGSGGLSSEGRRGVANVPSQASATLHRHSPPAHELRPVRLGFSRLSGFREDAARRIVAAREVAPFTSVEDLASRAGLDDHALRLLADANALSALAGHRREAAWAAAGVDTRRGGAMLRQTRTVETHAPVLAPPSAGEALLADYRTANLSLQSHPLALLRRRLATEFRVLTAAELRHCRSGQLARASGLVTHRQRPQTAKGVVFVTLEDETGAVNVIVWRQVAETQRQPMLAARLLTVYGIWQSQGEVMHLIAKRLVDHSALLRDLAEPAESRPEDTSAIRRGRDNPLRLNSRDFR